MHHLKSKVGNVMLQLPVCLKTYCAVFSFSFTAVLLFMFVLSTKSRNVQILHLLCVYRNKRIK